MNPIQQQIALMATKQIFKKLVAQIPLFGVGIFGFFTNQILWRVVKLVVVYSDLGLAFLDIENTKHEQVDRFKEASKALADAQESENKDEELIDRLEQEAIDRFRDMVKLKRVA